MIPVIQNLDLFGNLITLHFNKNSKMKSFIGGLLTMGYFLFIFITIIYFTTDFISNRQRTVILGEKVENNLQARLDDFFVVAGVRNFIIN